MIVAGLGFRTGASAQSLRSAFERASAGKTATALATAAEKCDSTALRDLATETGLRIIAVAADQLAAQPTVTQSAPSRAARGTGSVAEAAALAAAGPGARLCGPRAVSDDRMATCAFAIGETI
ncbi:cobalamin biosynthesis protein [Roseobacter ponti]|uniref:Cobalamin biosynthesis protein n=1 Tax=Roseobacter ponti TaxID=1891787 RepID=A0A858ST90_9RHOB|nr:cobalamin biosynthesis protein [Roseobacter ponti]QJF51895.1 cobalamin biosynthesis protein [Roseobacter ponti]